MARLSIEHVLCPTDLSDFSERALRHAVALCRWFGAQLSVLRVVPDVMPTPGGPDLPVTALASPALREEAERDLGRFAQPAIDAGIPVRTVLREGEPWREILHEAGALPADLVVMGTHGRSGFEHLLLGSVTEKVLRRATCPVLTVCHSGEPADAGLPFRRLLAATDLLPGADHTLAMAFAIAETSGAALTLVHAIENLPEPGMHPYLVVPELQAMREQLEQDARARFASLVPEDLRQRLGIEMRLVTGSARHEVLRLAGELQADLIVLGAHTRGPLEHLLFGSTCEQVVRRASCPVLTVRSVSPASAKSQSAPPEPEGRARSRGRSAAARRPLRRRRRAA
jgi:nucleotide-binding universal stress UspA family protein